MIVIPVLETCLLAIVHLSSVSSVCSIYSSFLHYWTYSRPDFCSSAPGFIQTRCHRRPKNGVCTGSTAFFAIEVSGTCSAVSRFLMLILANFFLSLHAIDFLVPLYFLHWLISSYRILYSFSLAVFSQVLKPSWLIQSSVCMNIHIGLNKQVTVYSLVAYNFEFRNCGYCARQVASVGSWYCTSPDFSGWNKIGV